MKLDLHMHSDASFDSTASVEELIRDCRNASLTCIAICDHNEIAGSLKAMKQNQIEVISGIEIDCTFHDRIIHLLGYGCDLNHPGFKQVRDHYAKELSRVGIEKIRAIETYYGISLDEKEISKLAKGKPYTNVEITQYLLANFSLEELLPYIEGNRSDSPIANFYWDMMYLEKPLYVPMNLPNYTEIIDLIHQAGGVVIVAHPKVNLAHDAEAIQLLVEVGISGFEVYSSYHDPEDLVFYLDQCKKYGLVYTCGSDYHGLNKPNIRLGNTGCINENEFIYTQLKKQITISQQSIKRESF